MIAQPRPLIEVFADIPDFRQAKGKRHPLPAILALACGAMLCGYRSYGAMAEWGRNYGSRIANALGFTPPCAATLFTLFGRLDRATFEAPLGAWADRGVAHTPAVPQASEEAMAVDGKTLRGSKKQGAPGTHWLSVLSHQLGLTLRQQAVDVKTNEIKAIETVLEPIVLSGCVLTMDALLTQRQVAQTIGDRRGDYVMIVKDNQPKLKEEIERVVTLPPAGDRQEVVRTVEVGHGRIETRNLTTSLSPEQADPGRLLELVRGHWHIENKSHWVRDVTFDEDRSQVRSGNLPQLMAALRNTAIGLLRGAGYTNIAKACRHMAAQPAKALALVGIEFEN